MIIVISLVFMVTNESTPQPFKPNGEPIATLVNINDFTYWVRANGRSGGNPWTGEPGGVYPRGTAPAIFQDGVVWAGRVNDGQTPELRATAPTTQPVWFQAESSQEGLPKIPELPMSESGVSGAIGKRRT